RIPSVARPMTIAAAPPVVSAPAPPAHTGLPIWQAPLVPIAVAVTTGVLLDRWYAVPLFVSLSAAVACLVAFGLHRNERRPLLGLLYLWTGFVALGGAYHHVRREGSAGDDVRHLATEEGRPARLRGIIDAPPTVAKGSGADPLRSFPRKDS